MHLVCHQASCCCACFSGASIGQHILGNLAVSTRNSSTRHSRLLPHSKHVQIMVASTTAFLTAGRFGLAPTVNKGTTAGLKLVDKDGGVKSGDPGGMCLSPVDCCTAV